MKTSPSILVAGILLTICVFCVNLSCFGQDIEPYKAKEIQPYKAKEIRVDKPKNVQSDRTNGVKTDYSKRKTDENKQTNTTHQKIFDISEFTGQYELWVPGTSYVTTDYSNQQRVLHNSAGTGVLPGGIKINNDQTYIWNSSWDNKIIKGHWKATDDSNYPIELLNAQEGKNWKVGKSNDKGVSIIIWDGYTWYNGRKR
ncbi:MAG: hypothetical protein WC780_08475 [Lentimicrobiaceae bacterium]|jgi:hypothetical protein